MEGHSSSYHRTTYQRTTFEGSQLLPRVPHTKVMKQGSHLTPCGPRSADTLFIVSISSASLVECFSFSMIGLSIREEHKTYEPNSISICHSGFPALPVYQHSPYIILVTSFTFSPKVHLQSRHYTFLHILCDVSPVEKIILCIR